jgi:hypothetical protein
MRKTNQLDLGIKAGGQQGHAHVIDDMTNGMFWELPKRKNRIFGQPFKESD